MPMPKGHVVRSRAGKIVGTGGLTPKQAAFVGFYVRNGARRTEAARLAGYAVPEQSAADLMENPAVIRAIHIAQASELRGDLATISLGVLRSILEEKERDDTAFKRLQLDAAKTVLDRAGHVAPKAEAAPTDPTGKPMSEWSIAELDAFIAESQAKLAAMRVVNAEPADSARASAQDRPIIDVETAEDSQSALPGDGDAVAEGQGAEPAKPGVPAPRWLPAPPTPTPPGEGEA